MADCKTNGHLWNSQRKCIMCECERPAEPAADYLHDLRVMATDALDSPIDARVPRHERDLVVQADIVGNKAEPPPHLAAVIAEAMDQATKGATNV